MTITSKSFVRLIGLIAMALVPAASSLAAEGDPPASTGFDAVAGQALSAMRAKALELHIGGVAVVAVAPGEAVTSWSSKMLVVGGMTRPPSDTGKGDNLLGIAYAKAAEMAATLKDSGSGVRAPYTGEYGWQGGVVVRGKAGILIAAFSGGRSEDDVAVSKAGMEVLGKAL